jgi:hypothetical protein
MILPIEARSLHGRASTVAFSKAVSFSIQVPQDTQHPCQGNATAVLDLYTIYRSTVAVVGNASVFYVSYSCSCNHNFHTPAIRTKSRALTEVKFTTKSGQEKKKNFQSLQIEKCLL